MVGEAIGDRRGEIDHRELGLIDQRGQRTGISIILINSEFVVGAETHAKVLRAQIAFHIKVRKDGGKNHPLAGAGSAMKFKDRLKIKRADAELCSSQLGEA